MSTSDPSTSADLSAKGHAVAEALERCAPAGDGAQLARTVAAAVSTQLGQSGARLGRFTSLRRLGGGALGVVYAAFDPDLGREVAIKILGRSSDAGKRRLWREALALSSIVHPNVLTVYEVGWFDGTAYIATELAPRGTLADWLAEPRSIASVLEMLSQVGHGLAAVHRCGLVHRDVKPANLFMGTGDRVLVGDFGLVARIGARGPVAPVEEPDRGELTVDGAAVGTFGYAAPEQWAGQPIDARADQYAFSITLARSLWGQQVSLAELLDGSPLPPTRSGERVPHELIAVLRRGLAIVPDDRHRDMAALVTALERIGDRLLARRARHIMASLLVAPILALLVWVFSGVR